MKRPNPQAAVDRWNVAHKVGTAVTVRKDDGSRHEGDTRSEAWGLGGHSAVILITDISGCYLLDRVSPR